MLLVKAIRRSRRGLRVAGGLILFGIVLHIAWLLVPAFDTQAAVIAWRCAGARRAGADFALLVGSAARHRCWRSAMPNEEMGSRRLPQPPDVAAGRRA